MGVVSQNSTLPCAITTFPFSLPLSFSAQRCFNALTPGYLNGTVLCILMAPVLVLNNGKMQHSITCLEHFPDDDDDEDVFVTRMKKVFVSPDFLIKRKKTSGLR